MNKINVKCVASKGAVIPVYKTESVLEFCVESVVAQNFKNLEIIIVNDGSLTETNKFFTNDYRSVVSKRQINKHEIIMQIPRDCLITLELAKSTSYGKEIAKIMYKELNSPKHCLLSSFLLTEEKKEKWKFYFDFLPNDFSNFPFSFFCVKLRGVILTSIAQKVNEKSRSLKNQTPAYKYLYYCAFIDTTELYAESA